MDNLENAITRRIRTVASHAIIWTVAVVITAGVIIRPFDWPQAVCAVAGAALLVMLGLLSATDALIGIANGRAGARSVCRKLRAASPRCLCSPSDSRAKSR